MVRVGKETLGLANQVDDALVDAELMGDFARVVLGWGRSVPAQGIITVCKKTYVPGYLPLRISSSERFLPRELSPILVSSIDHDCMSSLARAAAQVRLQRRAEQEHVHGIKLIL